MIGIALDVDDLRDGVFGLVAEGINDDAAAHGAIWASAAGLTGAGNFEALRLGLQRREIEPQRGESRAPKDGSLEEGPTREFHFVTPRYCTCQRYGGELLQAPTRPPSLMLDNIPPS